MSRFNKMIELTPAEEPLAGVDIGRGFYFISYPDYVPGETATPPSGCCCSCGCKKELTNGLCLKCADVEKLMAECLDESGKVDLSGHVGQRDELRTHFYFQDDPTIRLRSAELTAEYQGVDGQWHPLSELDNDMSPREYSAGDVFNGSYSPRSITELPVIGRYLVVPSCFPLEDYIFPFRILHDAHILDRALRCGTFSFEETSYTVKDIDFDEQILTATRNP